jgi:hypothetical protein
VINIPVLVIAYNRPFLLEKLLSHLNYLEVTKIYVALDGPKNQKDSVLCAQALNIVKVYKDKFEIKVLYRDYNLGCCLGVISALDWFFSQENFGSVIEDDCIPDPSFFKLLSVFNENTSQAPLSRLGIFTAHNPFDHNFRGELSNTVLIHGWATHSSVWKKIRKNYFTPKLPSVMNKLGETRNLREALYWWSNSTRAKLGIIDTWDGIFNDQVWRLGIKTLIPESNMVKNLGFGPFATHTKDNSQSNQVLLDKEILSNGELNFLLNKYYFKIKHRHIFTSLIRVLIDLLRFHKPKQFEKLLRYDLSVRKTELP